MKKSKLELSVTKKCKEGKSKVEVFNPEPAWDVFFSVDGNRIDCRSHCAHRCFETTDWHGQAQVVEKGTGWRNG